MKTLTMTAGAVIACIVAGCASKPPAELKSARSAYQDVAQSPAATIATADVYEAKKHLDRAEKAFSDDGDEPETRDLAYVAERKAIIARARANAMVSMQQKQVAIAEAERYRQQQAQAAREQLGQTKEQLTKTQAQLESERQARVAAEQRSMDALTKIQGLTAKQETRGLVLTLSGSVLFASGKSELLPTAQKRLDEVVTALKEDGRSMTIMGHTDAVGDESKNLDLSQRRAEAVRAYLVSRGIPQDRVTAQGVGEAQPIADNKTAPGRANNRRVEIVLQGAAMGGEGGGAMPGGGRMQSGSGIQQGGTTGGSGMQKGGTTGGSGMQQGGSGTHQHQQMPGTGAQQQPGNGTRR